MKLCSKTEHDGQTHCEFIRLCVCGWGGGGGDGKGAGEKSNLMLAH